MPRLGRRRTQILIVAAAMWFSWGDAALLAAQAQTPAPATPDSLALDHRVIAYYFHTNYRCASCRQIEAYSHAAIEAAFPEELASGKLVWRLVNVEEKGNEHFVDDYELYTKALVIVDETNGKQVRWKNLEKVWELLQRQEKFYAYVQEEVRDYLNEVP